MEKIFINKIIKKKTKKKKLRKKLHKNKERERERERVWGHNSHFLGRQSVGPWGLFVWVCVKINFYKIR